MPPKCATSYRRCGEVNPDAPVPRHVKKAQREVNALWSAAA
jgi:hypothetical protein